MEKQYNPWPGLASYKDPGKIGEESRYQFCGRQSETYDLLQLIENRSVVTLYGSTGIGKTSLLCAGVFPILRQRCDFHSKAESGSRFYPVYVRLCSPSQLEENTSNMTYAEILIKCIEKDMIKKDLKIKVSKAKTSPYKDEQGYAVWHYFHTHHFYNDDMELLTPVIVLDQFEEVFAIRETDEKIETFLIQLYTLAEDRLPWKEYNGYHAADFRFVISLREDKFFYMENYVDTLRLSLFKENRYRLLPLSDEQAKQVITIPGEKVIDYYNKEEISRLIIEQSRNKDRGDINTLLLSLICNQIYEKSSPNHKFTLEIVKELSPNVLKQFYIDITSRLPLKQRQAMELLLVTNGRRNRVPLKEFEEKVSDGAYLYDEQQENRILCEEGKYVEIIHDQLALIIEKQKSDTKLELYQQRISRLKKWGALTVIAVVIVIITSFVPNILWQSTYELDERLENYHLYSEWYSRPLSIPTGILNLERNDTVYYKTFSNHPELRELHLGDNCMINKESFIECPNLRVLYLDGREITIGEQAFRGCNQLETIIVSDSCTIRSMDRQASLPALKYIATNENPNFMAFGNSLLVKLKSFDSIKQQDSVCWKIITGSAKDSQFKYQDSDHSSHVEWHTTGNVLLPMLSEPIDLDSMNADYGRIWYIRNGIPDTMSYTVVTCQDKSVYTNPHNIRGIKKIVSVEMPYIIHIGPRAFSYCEGLRTVSLPNVGDIGKEAFYVCSELKHIYTPRVSYIEDRAFQSCKSLYEIDMPIVEVVDTGAFAFCQSLTKINMPKLTIVKQFGFEGCALEEVDMPNVKVLEEQSFANCHWLRKICLPQLEKMDNYAFYGCYSLEEIIMPTELAEKMVDDIIIQQRSPYDNYNYYFNIVEKRGNLAVIRSSNISNGSYEERRDTLDFSRVPKDCSKLIISKNVKAISHVYSEMRHRNIEVAFDNPKFFSFKNTVYNKDGIVLNAQAVEHAYFMNYDIGTGYRGYNSDFTHDLKTIFFKYPQYNNIFAALRRSYSTERGAGVCIDTAAMKNIVIQVPYGYKKYCQNLPQFKLFGPMEELSIWETLIINAEWSIKQNLRGTFLNQPFRFYAILIVAILLILSCLTGYIFLGKSDVSLAVVTLIGHLVSIFLIITFFYTLEFNYGSSMNRIDIPLTLMLVFCFFSLFTPWFVLYMKRVKIHKKIIDHLFL